MKMIKFLTAVAAVSVALVSCKNQGGAYYELPDELPAVIDGVAAPCQTEIDTMSYLWGVNFGSMIKMQPFANSLDELNMPEIKQGFVDFLDSKGNPMDVNFAKQFKVDLQKMNEIISDYLTKRNGPAPEVTDSTAEASVITPTLVNEVSYLLGAYFANSMKGRFADRSKDVNFGKVAEGMDDFMHSQGEPRPDNPEFTSQFKIDLVKMDSIFYAFFQKKGEYAQALNKWKEKDFLAKNGKKCGVKTTESGLQYKMAKKGDSYKVQPEDTVLVNYKGQFLDGSVFDQNDSITFAANQVIKGWTEGLGLLGKGGKVRLFVPYELAYGARGSYSIPPFSTLVFDVEILDIMPCAKPEVEEVVEEEVVVDSTVVE